ncbi:MAG: ATP phosphoribosyltransferase regulatory subunit, partial [Thermoplasmata archaeon]|nr:ATP phosphoribosyltransferase regulatory subunit [Thermoplasmata archaeon]
TAETIAMAVEMVKASGVENVSVRVGHIGVLRSLLEDAGIPIEEQYFFLHRIDKGEVEELHTALIGKVGAENASTIMSVVKEADDIEAALPHIKGLAGAQECVERLVRVRELLKWIGVEAVRPDLAVVRGLDYYTGIVFEIDAPALGAEKQICGGGEYRLAHLFGGTDVATVGFAMGFDRLLLAAEKEDIKVEPPSLDYFIIPIKEEALKTALAVASSLRRRGHRVDIDLMGRSLKKGMKYASSRNTRTAVLIGPRGMENGVCTFHDMNTGEDEKMALEELLR